MKAHGWTQGQMAEKVGKSQQSISDSLTLLTLSPDVQDFTRRLVISKYHGIYISKLGDKSDQSVMAKLAVEHQWSAEKTKIEVKKRLRVSKPRKK